MSDVRYSKEHEWVKLDGDVATIGITQHAAEQLGDIVYVELPEPGRTLGKDGDAAVVESVKAASDVYAPLSGDVTEANDALTADPAQVNADPEGAAWFFKMKVANKAEFDGLMTREQYDAFVQNS